MVRVSGCVRVLVGAACVKSAFGVPSGSSTPDTHHPNQGRDRSYRGAAGRCGDRIQPIPLFTSTRDRPFKTDLTARPRRLHRVVDFGARQTIPQPRNPRLDIPRRRETRPAPLHGKDLPHSDQKSPSHDPEPARSQHADQTGTGEGFSTHLGEFLALKATFPSQNTPPPHETDPRRNPSTVP